MKFNPKLLKELLMEWNSTTYNESALTNISDMDKEFEKILQDGGGYNRFDGKHILVIVLCALAIVTNSTTLTAIRHIRRRLTANQTMMFSLCCADLLTSVGVLGRVINQQAFEMHTVDEKYFPTAVCVYKVIQAIIFTGHNATLFNLLCLAVDHYCAIGKPLTYSVFMSKRRVHIILGIFWTLSVIFGFSDFLIPAPLHKHCISSDLVNYCERAYCSTYEPDHLMFGVVLLCLAVMIVMYGMIMWILYRYQHHEYGTVSERKAQRHIRGLITSFIILGLFAILWLPNCVLDIYTILMAANQDFSANNMHQKVYWYLYAFVILNAICDPIVYAMRMREIQQSLQLLLCFRRPTFNNQTNGFGEQLRHTSSGGLPLKYVQRQYSNSTNTTMTSSMPNSTTTSLVDSGKNGRGRKGTLSSQTSDVTEETPFR